MYLESEQSMTVASTPADCTEYVSSRDTLNRTVSSGSASHSLTRILPQCKSRCSNSNALSDTAKAWAICKKIDSPCVAFLSLVCSRSLPPLANSMATKSCSLGSILTPSEDASENRSRSGRSFSDEFSESNCVRHASTVNSLAPRQNFKRIKNIKKTHSFTPLISRNFHLEFLNVVGSELVVGPNAAVGGFSIQKHSKLNYTSNLNKYFGWLKSQVWQVSLPDPKVGVVPEGRDLEPAPPSQP